MPLTDLLGAVTLPLTHLLGALQIGDTAAGGWVCFGKCPVIRPNQPYPTILSGPSPADKESNFERPLQTCYLLWSALSRYVPFGAPQTGVSPNVDMFLP